MPEPYPTEQVESDTQAVEPHVELAERYALIPETLLYDPSIPADAVRLYGVLRRHGSDPANCFPSHRRLAELIGRSVRSIPAWIRALEDAGWVERVARTSPEGDPTSNGYRVFATPRRAAERGVRAEQRGGVRAEQQGGYTPESAAKESKRTKARENKSSRALAQASLDLPLSAPEQSARDERAERRATAERLLRAWWESRDPRPTQNYVGARKVLERLLEAGWTADQLTAALPTCVVISAASCELALRRRHPPTQPAMDGERDESGEWVYESGEWRLVG